MLHIENSVTQEHMLFHDIKSFEKVFREYYAPLAHYCMTIVKSETVSEDIVQAVFTELWSQRDTLEVHTSAKALLYKSVYFKALNHLKHQKIVSKHLSTLPSNPHESKDPAMETELAKSIKLAIEKLPPNCKKIFTMSRYENLKYAEIAESLNLSIKTVENQMGKALKLLREDLSPYLTSIILMFINILL